MTPKEKDIQKLLDLLNVKETTFRVVFLFLKSYFPDLSEEGLRKIMTLFRDKMGFEEMLSEYIKVYAKVYTHLEIKEMIVFYGSPVGRKVVESSVRIFEETEKTTAKWLSVKGADVQEDVVKIFQAEEDLKTSQKADIINKRAAFVYDYSTKNGWNPSRISEEQMDEIRTQEEWKV